MTPLRDRRPIEFHQLCAIARTVIQADPTISDNEWDQRTQDKAAAQGYDSPEPQMLVRALRHVENALTRTLGSRPLPAEVTLVPPPTIKPTQDDPPWRRTPGMAQQWASIAELIANLQGSKPSAPSSDVPEVTADEILPISEDAALQVFWNSVCPVDAAERVAVLRTFAEVAIERPAGWDPKAIRAEADQQQHRRGAVCLACRHADRPIDWHHVIQIQHGGSNTVRNRVPLCEICHARVHPWLPAPDPGTRRGGFVKAIALAGSVYPGEPIPTRRPKR